MAAMGKDLSWIDRYYDFRLPARHSTWNEANELGAGRCPASDYGLTGDRQGGCPPDAGKGHDARRSHLNEAGFWDLMKITKKPFIASHSNSRALCDVPRNLTDDQLRAIRDVNGVVGLNAFNLFIDDDPANQTVQRLAEHAAHMIDVMGIDHVGCGFDFFEFIDNPDTMGTMTDTGSPCTKGLANASEIPNIFACFEKMGMSKEDMEKIARLNFQRVVRTQSDKYLHVEKSTRQGALLAWAADFAGGEPACPGRKSVFTEIFGEFVLLLGRCGHRPPTNLLMGDFKNPVGRTTLSAQGSTEFAEDFSRLGHTFCRADRGIDPAKVSGSVCAVF